MALQMQEVLGGVPSRVDYPAQDAFAVTPSDSVLQYFRALYVGNGVSSGSTPGDVVIVTLGGTTVTFKNVPLGSVLPIAGSQVNSTNTTATSIVGLI